ncbi:Lipase (class 3) [Microdochium nivale]|nr:Lipase (class 3) [Microdochium nivale]
MTDFNFNLSQQVYCLSSASNAVGSMRGTEADLQTAMDTALASELPKITGGWQKSWGPRVYKQKAWLPGAAENVWFAAVSESQSTVVVAVSGTAPVSIQDWLDDMDVEKVVNFDAWVAQWPTGIKAPVVDKHPDSTKAAYCARGTAMGVYNILNNVEHTTKTHVWDYLKGLGAGYTVIFTGHSMGGAITPTLALGLSIANMSGSDQTYTMPSAGPTSGNALFVDRYKQIYPATSVPGSTTGYQVLNLDLFNTDDVVPQAWSLDPSQDRNLTRILGDIYSPTLVTSKWAQSLASFLVNYAKQLSTKSAIQYVPIPGQPFTGPSLTGISTLGLLGRSILSNHTTDYWEYIGIDKFVSSFEDKVCEHPRVDKPEASLEGGGEQVVSRVVQDVQQKLVQA